MCHALSIHQYFTYFGIDLDEGCNLQNKQYFKAFFKANNFFIVFSKPTFKTNDLLRISQDKTFLKN